MISSQCWLISGVEIWGAGAKAYILKSGGGGGGGGEGMAPLAPLVPPPMHNFSVISSAIPIFVPQFARMMDEPL